MWGKGYTGGRRVVSREARLSINLGVPSKRAGIVYLYEGLSSLLIEKTLSLFEVTPATDPLN